MYVKCRGVEKAYPRSKRFVQKLAKKIYAYQINNDDDDPLAFVS